MRERRSAGIRTKYFDNLLNGANMSAIHPIIVK